MIPIFCKDKKCFRKNPYLCKVLLKDIAMYSEDYDDANIQERSGEDVYSKQVRAGKRTYFFDVKATKGNDYYLTITESKRRIERDGRFAYDKHKIFLYKEDFDKFVDSLEEMVKFIKANCPVPDHGPAASGAADGGAPYSSDVNFDEL